MLPLLLAAALSPAAQGFDPDPEGLADRWVVAYNLNWPDEDGDGMGDSEQLARYYALRRGVPPANLIGLSCPTTTTYSGASAWQDFWDEMIDPLRAKVQQFPEDHILGLLFCYGLPYDLRATGFGPRGLDTTLMTLWTLGDRNAPHFKSMGHADAYFDPDPTIGTDPGRFDPAVHRRQGLRTYLVSRIDGLDLHHSMELVDFALYGDAYLSPQPGYYSGNAYCDTRYGAYTWAELAGYPFGHDSFADADKDMAYGRQWLEQPGFPLKWEPYGTEIGEPGAQFEDGSSALTAPNALWYEGWYNYNKYLDVWDWMVGSAACDLNSNSIARFRQVDPGTFLGQALQRGLTCGPGCIAEPFLNGHPYPEVFTYYLLNGYPFGDAARISDPKAKWTQIYMGDPLYQPMRVGKTALLDTQAPSGATALTASATATPGEWEITTHLDTTAVLPDVGLLTLHHGPDPSYGATVSGEDDRPRIFHTAVLTGLGSDELVHYRADYLDPAGNAGAGEELILHTAIETQAVVARIEAPSGMIPAFSDFDVELIFGAQDGASSLTGITATVSAAHLGWNQLDLRPQFAPGKATHYGSAGDLLRSARLTVTGGLAAGSYLVEVSAVSPAGSDLQSVTLDVQ